MQLADSSILSVVAVHRLNFRGNVDHAWDTWEMGDKLWLRDFLPARLSRPARVMLYAYNSSPAIRSVALNIDDHVNSLLQWLSLGRKSAERRPLVFLCHSLGGLVVKEALIEAKANERFAAIAGATCLLVFFATPHQGSGLASLGDIAARIVQTVSQAPRNDLLEALKKTSEEAQRRFKKARHLFDKYYVVSFYEEQPYGQMGIIVDQKSATLSLPGSREKQVPISANHSTICKFDSVNGAACNLVLETIATELEDLRITDPRDDKRRIEESKGNLLRDACHWVLDSPEFHQWRHDEQSRLLWVKGDPGKGKTMLLCGIIDELGNTDSASRPLSFFFCQGTDSRINHATAVLRGLLFLLLEKQPCLLQHVRQKYDLAGRALFEDVNAWAALSTIFTSVLEDPILLGAYIVIDALDECQTDQLKLVDWIVQMSSRFPRVRWVVSSRNWPIIEKNLNQVREKAMLSLELNEKSVSAAVETYIRCKVAQVAARNQYSDEERATVQHGLSSNARGTFLWVALVCQELRDTPGWEAEEQLRAFPPGLNDFYGEMMGRLRRSRRAALCSNILAVMSAVYRPVTLEELKCLVELPRGSPSNDNAMGEIIRECGSLLTLREQERTIYFVHQSAKEFLIDTKPDGIFPSGIRDSHRAILLKSLQAMTATLRRDIYKLDDPGLPIDKIRPPNPDPLSGVRYPCVYWIDHLHEYHVGGDTKPDLQDDGPVDRFQRHTFLYWMEALSLLRSLSTGMHSIKRFDILVQLTSLVRDERRFIHSHSATVEKYPLQLYASALIFSPLKSITKGLSRAEEPSWLARVPLMEDEWSSCLQTIDCHDHWARSVAWSADGWLASGSYSSTIRLWDPVTVQCQLTLKGHTRQVNSVAWSSDGQLASGSHDNTIRLWDPVTGQCQLTLKGHTRQVNSVAWSSDGQLASASCDDTIRLWDPVTGHCQLTLKGHTRQVNSVAWSSDGQLASGSHDNTIRLWDPVTGQCHLTLKGHTRQVNSVAWSSESQLTSASHDHTIKLWNRTTGECQLTLQGHTKYIRSVAWSASGRLASGSHDNTIRLWDPVTGQCQLTLKGHTRQVISVAWSSDGQLASTADDFTIKLWDLNTIEFQTTIESHTEHVISAAWSSDGCHLASSSTDGTIKLWDPTTGQCQLTLADHSQQVTEVAWSSDGCQLASASSDETVKVWDPKTGQCRMTLVASDWVRSIAWSTDGCQLASASSDGIIRLWDPVTGVCQRILEGHDWGVYSVAWSADGCQLASASSDKTVKVWDPKTARIGL
ncbi:WD40 repeat-like protein [Thozetella sp. PMI_491]|nr:WD40 repeat-like protein [Thozetella sp. PMI_491]